MPKTMQAFLEGRKTYIGIITLLIGALGVSKYVTDIEVSQIVDAVLTVVGAVVAIYGRYKAPVSISKAKVSCCE